MHCIVVFFITHVQLFATPWTAACHTSLSFIFWSLLKLMSIESVMIGTHSRTQRKRCNWAQEGFALLKSQKESG